MRLTGAPATKACCPVADRMSSTLGYEDADLDGMPVEQASAADLSSLASALGADAFLGEPTSSPAPDGPAMREAKTPPSKSNAAGAGKGKEEKEKQYEPGAVVWVTTESGAKVPGVVVPEGEEAEEEGATPEEKAKKATGAAGGAAGGSKKTGDATGGKTDKTKPAGGKAKEEEEEEGKEKYEVQTIGPEGEQATVEAEKLKAAQNAKEILDETEIERLAELAGVEPGVLKKLGGLGVLDDKKLQAQALGKLTGLEAHVAEQLALVKDLAGSEKAEMVAKIVAQRSTEIP